MGADYSAPRSKGRSKGFFDLCATCVVCVALSAAFPSTSAYAEPSQSEPASKQAPEIRLADDIVTLPIVMVREFPFIEGAIAGISGKLMLDTGAEKALALNDHRVPVAGGKKIGTGFFGSGQTFDIRLVPEIRDIRIGSLRYPRATNVQAQDARLLEEITPDFIGWFGFNAFASHAFKLDYRNSRATFYKAGAAEYLRGERVIAELPFETRKLPNHPIIPAKIDEMSVVTAWDTGQNGTLHTSEDKKARLLKSGRLKPSRTEPDTYDLHGLKFFGRTMPVVTGIEVDTEPSPAARSIGITEPDELSLGYALLRHFKTVWDFRTHRIYLLAR